MFQRFVKTMKLLLGLDRAYKRAVVITVDALICTVAVWLAFSLRLGVWDLWSKPIFTFGLTCLVFWLPVFYYTGVYQIVFRFAGSGTILGLAKATLGFFVPIFVIYGLYGITGVPRTVSVLHPILFFCGLVLSRIVMRYLLVDILSAGAFRGKYKNILIYGAGSSGQQLAASLKHDPSMRLFGFADDNSAVTGHRINGKKVYAGANIQSVVHDHAITDVLLAMPSTPRSVQQRLIARLSHLSVRVQVLPSLNKILDGQLKITDLRDVSIEDLLGRAAVSPDDLLMKQAIAGKTVLVTGAGGSIGSELCRQILASRPETLVLAEITEHALYQIEHELVDRCRDENVACAIIAELVNVAEQTQVARLFRKWQPDIVFHAAAYKHVPLIEANPISGMRNNIYGTLHSAIEANRFGVTKFILVSTDKAVRPTNVMGASKRACELILQSLSSRDDMTTQFSMVRFGNVLGSSGSVVPKFMKQIRAGGPVTLTDQRITRFFMTIPEAAQLVIQAGAMARGGEVFLLDMGDSVRIADLAISMINLSGLTVRSSDHPDGDIEIVEIGLRPGEKLYEELLINARSEHTDHERIMRAEERFIEWPQLEHSLTQLERQLLSGDSAAALSILKTMVPEFSQSLLENK